MCTMRTTTGCSALLLAHRYGGWPTVKVLLAAGASYTHVCRATGDTLLHVTARDNDADAPPALRPHGC